MGLVFIPRTNAIEVYESDGRTLVYMVSRDDRGWRYSNHTTDPPRRSSNMSFLSADAALRRLTTKEDRRILAGLGQAIDWAWPEECRFTDNWEVRKDLPGSPVPPENKADLGMRWWRHRFSSKLNMNRNWPCINTAVVWTRDQMGPPGHWWTHDHRRWICFHREADALAFKIRWC